MEHWLDTNIREERTFSFTEDVYWTCVEQNLNNLLEEYVWEEWEKLT